jgi:hypothetical protein
MIEMIYKLIGKIINTEEIPKNWNIALLYTKRMLKNNVKSIVP